MNGLPPASGGDTRWDPDIVRRKEGREMKIGNGMIGLAAFFALLMVIAMPVTAAEKTIQLNSPGCNA